MTVKPFCSLPNFIPALFNELNVPVFIMHFTINFRFEKNYTLTITVKDKSGERSASLTKCVGDVFDEDGVLLYDTYRPLVLNLHDSLARGKKAK